MPTFTGTESLEVGRAVERINEEHANSPPQTIDEVCALVQDLCVHPPTSPVEDPENCEPPAAIVSSTHTLHMETVAETVHPPLLLARRAMATPARGVPNPPTITTKCPRKDCHVNEEVRQKPKRPKALSALREIRKLQEEVEPILPWLPFVRLIHKLLFTRGPYRIQCQAIQALRIAAEAYIVEVLGGGNLAFMHRDRCTLAPKDIRLFRRLRGDVDSMEETPVSEEARRADWRRYKKDCLTSRRGHGIGHHLVPQAESIDSKEEAEVPEELEVLTPHLQTVLCAVVIVHLSLLYICISWTYSTWGPGS